MEFQTLVDRTHRRKSANAIVVIALITLVSLALEYLAGWAPEEIIQSFLTFCIVFAAAATRFKTRRGESDRLWITAAWGKIVGWAESVLENLERRSQAAATPPADEPQGPTQIARRTRVSPATLSSDRPTRGTPLGEESSIEDLGYD